MAQRSLGSGRVDLAKTFECSKVKKRFLKQAVALKRVLEAHGFNASFPPCFSAPTVLGISRGEHFVAFGTLTGERRFQEAAPILYTCNISGWETFPGTRCVASDQNRGALEGLIGWGMLREDEITQEELEGMFDDCLIRCSRCQARQPYAEGAPRFKQCSLCHREDKTKWIPDYHGFYCGGACQAEDWAEHKKKYHP